MKVNVTISDITHDDLVNLLSTATYGSEYLTCKVPKGSYRGTELEDENDCAEDMLAKVLLSGKPIFVYDYYSEEEAYGTLPHEWREDKGAMRYTLTLEDIKKGLERAMSSDKREVPHDEAVKLMTDSDDFDFCDADFLMQYIVFGSAIYG